MNPLLRQLDLTYPERLRPAFWLDGLPDADVPLITPAEIASFNDHVRATLGFVDPYDLPDTLPADEIRVRINEAMPRSWPLYGGDGQPLTEVQFARLTARAQVTLPDEVPVQFGLIVETVDARALPAHAIITSEPLTWQTNLLQETVLDTGWPVAVCAASADGGWYFCLTPLYWGWVPRRAVALTTRDEARTYWQTAAADFVMTTASRASIGTACGDGIATQMGTRLPLLDESAEIWRVSLPTVEDGRLRLTTGTISRAAGGFQRGWLPCTPRTILTAAFSMLGEPYAWGGMQMGIFGRDCSRFIQDVYALTGVALPRNSGQQKQVGRLRVEIPADMPADERRRHIAAQARPGDIVWFPGHVMLYTGDIDGEPHVIHATGGQYMAVVVSTFDLYANMPAGSLLERVRQIVHVAAPKGV